MFFVITERGVVVQHDHDWNFVMNGGPDRGRSHGEIAIANDGDGKFALIATSEG